MAREDSSTCAGAAFSATEAAGAGTLDAPAPVEVDGGAGVAFAVDAAVPKTDALVRIGGRATAAVVLGPAGLKLDAAGRVTSLRILDAVMLLDTLDVLCLSRIVAGALTAGGIESLEV